MGAMFRMSTEGTDAFIVELERFQQNFTDAAPAFEAMADFQRTIWERQFDQEGAYTGAGRWSALKPEYSAWKQRHFPGKPILELTGLLRESMTQRPFGIDEISDHVMVIGTGVPYASFHQHGTDNMPARPMIQKPSELDRLKFAKILHNWIVKGTVD